MADDRFPSTASRRYSVTVLGYVKGAGAGGWADMSSEPDGKGATWSVPTYAISDVKPIEPVPAHVAQFWVRVGGEHRIGPVTWAEAVSFADELAQAGEAPEIRLASRHVEEVASSG